MYWTNCYGVQSQDFAEEELNQVLSFMEGLRRQQRNEAEIAHVALSISHPDSVGNPGVDVTGKDYDWKKRRP